MLSFRDLKAEEVEVRVAKVDPKIVDGKQKSKYGVMLLLYKDARCDQNILDETVGPMNWQRHHTRENANCIVSIWNDEIGQWIDKEDTGTESYTEKEKGLASDSFKRACFNWGIGRELYTAPSIYVDGGLLSWNKDGNKIWDRFSVAEIGIENKRIISLTIEGTNPYSGTSKSVYHWDSKKEADVQEIKSITDENITDGISEDEYKTLMGEIESRIPNASQRDKYISGLLKGLKVSDLKEINKAQYLNLRSKVSGSQS